MVSSIILAAGSGKRMGKAINKVFLDLNGRPVLFYSIRAFENNPEVDEIILVMKEEEIAENRETIEGFGFSKIRSIVPGGRERMHSVREGLSAVSESSELVLIHDGARPFVTDRIIEDAIRFSRQYGAACPGVMPKDTIKVAGKDSMILESLDREALCAVQTPQAFQTGKLITLMDSALQAGHLYTDDTAVFTDAGLPVYLFEGSFHNLKLTTEEDLSQAAQIVQEYDKF